MDDEMDEPEVELLSEHPEWADVVPIPQRESAEPVVQILYDNEYSDAMGLLRALMLKGELSPRALHLTTIIIFMNSAHLTVWEFRRCVLASLNSKGKWLAELEFMDEVNRLNTKNYQLWNHRRAVLSTILPATSSERERTQRLRADTTRSEHTLDAELHYLEHQVFREDAKHYHAWAHRQWLVSRFGCWDGELAMTRRMIQRDKYNNSAWNHRFYALSKGAKPLGEAPGGGEGGEGAEKSPFQKEVLHTMSVLEETPENESCWSFLTGLLFRGPSFLRVSPAEFAEVVEVLTKFCKVLEMGKMAKKGAKAGVKRASFRANMSYLLALRLLGKQDKGSKLWEGLSDLLDAQAHLRSATEDFAALRTTDPIRSAAYDVKIALARKIMGECA